jgi:hypothetical protein
MRGRDMAIVAVFFSMIGFSAPPAGAQAQPETPKQEAPALTDAERLLDCDRDLCAIVTNPSAAGAPLRCDLSVLWPKEELVKAINKGRISWPFGDAKCSAKVNVDREILAPAIKTPAYTLTVPPQPIACEIDNDGSRHQVTANMAPVMEFKDGKATSVDLGLKDIKGSAVISNAVWAAWKLESYFGYFQEALVKGVNGYIENWCPNREAALKEASTPK